MPKPLKINMSTLNTSKVNDNTQDMIDPSLIAFEKKQINNKTAYFFFFINSKSGSRQGGKILSSLDKEFNYIQNDVNGDKKTFNVECKGKTVSKTFKVGIKH